LIILFIFQPLSLDRFFIHEVSPAEAATARLENAFILINLNRFQQIISVFTLQAESEQMRVNMALILISFFHLLFIVLLWEDYLDSIRKAHKLQMVKGGFISESVFTLPNHYPIGSGYWIVSAHDSFWHLFWEICNLFVTCFHEFRIYDFFCETFLVFF
jgi:hypothetical protein